MPIMLTLQRPAFWWPLFVKLVHLYGINGREREEVLKDPNDMSCDAPSNDKLEPTDSQGQHSYLSSFSKIGRGHLRLIYQVHPIH